MNRTTRKQRPQKRFSDTCPKCGYCDKCGRSNAAPAWPWPVTPYVPYVPYTPPLKPWYGPVQMPGINSFPATPLTSGTGLSVTTSNGCVIDKAGN